ncbi:beta-fructofuranosidase, insoluble isoenzyme CWINV6-like [Cynara cardunculus var. scolymus]|uniref:beta-fructofuranosidase, insoluble isoenzyme CWINV6-like n=1 Tax=Cynara cardunculus var. scolymus TaxID=59895 RepID=UPI000D62DC94|nr:beta-fructofuranosidase, insoluble isoenzyme CWINV6-like [Cynara cardunculus var. scolymus]
MMKSLVSILTLCFLGIVGTEAAGRNLKDVISLPSQRFQQPYRTGYHFQPPSNWMNDPNGPMLYEGVYHFFYQYNPYAATFGDLILWGHAVSYDLVNWIHLDPAIYPTHEADSKSCWSGSATILPGNIPMMLYTGSDSQSRQVQDLAWPKNLSDPFLREWVKYENNPIITPPEGVKDDCFRDPSTAWKGPDGVWRMVVGADRDNDGMAFLYQSTDFKNWKRHEQPLSSAEDTGTWECPDFYPVPLNSTNGLDTSTYSGSVMHVMKAGFEGHDWYTIGTYSPVSENFLPQNGLRLSGSKLDLRYDYGNFYASKSFFDDSKNRRVLWGWIPESDSQEDDIEKGWAGLQSFPRAVWIDRSGKQLIQWPVEEIETLRENEVKLENKKLDSACPVYEIQGITASQADVTVSFKLEGLTIADTEDLDTTSVDPQALCTERGASSKGAFGPFGLLAMASKDRKEQTAIFFRVFYDQKIKRYAVLMCSDLSRSTIRSNIDTTSYGAFVDIDLQNNNEISLRNLIDRSIIESFGAEGKTCITSRVYPKFAYNEDAHLFAFNNGTRSVTISKMSAWSMKDAEFVIDQTEKSAV